MAVAAHFALDTVPHWQETLSPYAPTAATWIRVPIDLLLSVVLVEAIARSHEDQAGFIRATAAAATLPDIDAVLYAEPIARRIPPPGERVRRFERWHAGIQRETASLWGILPQAAVCLVCLAIGLRRSADTQ
jgi:hypothetical protein